MPHTHRTAVVIEDDDAVREILLDVFEAAGFTAVGAANGLDGVALVSEHSPLITTVDVNMPGIDGFETVRRVRGVSGTYIVLVTARADESDAVLGLTLGADDYVTKPFRPREFRARVEAMLRRPRAVGAKEPSVSAPAAPATAVAETPRDEVLTHRDLALDACNRVVLQGGLELVLTRTEFDLLQTLLESQRRPRSKEDLVMVARGDEPATSIVTDHDKRAIEVHVTNLRRKLSDPAAEPRYIETVRGIGYRLTVENARV
jgi:two-component system OmpR family response regulator